MPAAFITAGASLLGGAMQGDAARSAARTSAAAQVDAARIAADAARFRPVGITTRYGTSNFQMSPEGYVTGAGYEVSPELKAYQDRLQGLTERGLTQAERAQQQYLPLSTSAESLFGLGELYLQQTPEQTAQKYMESQYNLIAPSRERQLAQLQNQLYQQGRSGLSVGGTGLRPGGGEGLRATSPEMEAYYNALAQQDLQIASQADQAGQQRTAFGAGLFGSGSQLLGQYQSGQVGALNPFTTYLGSGSTLEQLGQQPLEMGSLLGGRSAQAGGNVGQALLTGGISAARAQQAGAYNPFATAISGLANNQQFGQGVSNYFNDRALRQQEQAAMENPFGSVGF